MGIGDVAHQPKRNLLGSMPAYPWVVVGLLWFCGFFNYADRQALSAVVPLLKSEFHLIGRAARDAGLGVHDRLRGDVAVYGLHGRLAVSPALDHARAWLSGA